MIPLKYAIQYNKHMNIPLLTRISLMNFHEYIVHLYVYIYYAPYVPFCGLSEINWVEDVRLYDS